MKKLIVIPARGGSKGIPMKNIYPLAGKPLLSYTLDLLAEAKIESSDIVVSTDSEAIKNIALGYNGVVVIDRPAYLAGDTVLTEDVLLHALDYMENKKQIKYECVLTMQPTSPLRRCETLKAFINKYETSYPKIDAMLSLTEDRSDFWICKSEKYQRLDPNAPRRRQERNPLYVENSAYYIVDSEALKNTRSVLGNRVDGFLISNEEGIDINEYIDLKIAESLLIK